MALSDLQPGDRIRMVTFGVAISDTDGKFTVRKQNLRFDWRGNLPEHGPCDALTDGCDYCDSEVQRLVARRLQPGQRIVGITCLRDGQTTMIDRSTQPTTTEAAA